MSRFNQKSTNPRKTENFEGSKAYSITPELELYSLICTSVLQPKYYQQDSMQDIHRIRKLLKDVDIEFACKLAVYARKEMNLRTIPLVLLVEIARATEGESTPMLRKAVTETILRADEITEIYSYYILANDIKGVKKIKKMSSSIKKGVKDAFYKFEEYQFAKYNRKTDITFKDALFISHPGKNDLFDKIVEGTLEVPYTWEVEFSELGKKAFENDIEKNEAFKEKWEEMIDSGKLGYMALIRNLRNICKFKVSDKHISKVCERLSDPKQVAKARMFPFNFLSAYIEISGENRTGMYTTYARSAEFISVDPFIRTKVLAALEKAVIASVENIKGFGEDTRVLLASDVSASMQKSISDKSSIQMYDIGLLLSQLLQSKCKTVISGIFGDIWSEETLPSANILKNTVDLQSIEGKVGYSTNGYKVIEYLIEKNMPVDKIMMFTDLQLWNSDMYDGDPHIEELWSKYKRNIPEAKLYLFDLAGHGKTPIDIVEKKGVYLISGWSSEIFNVLDNIENGGDVLDRIKKINLD